jgi:hypothetical protein
MELYGLLSWLKKGYKSWVEAYAILYVALSIILDRLRYIAV